MQQILLDLVKKEIAKTSMKSLNSKNKQATSGDNNAESYNPIDDYKNTLKEQGYSDEVINGVSQGLNYGNKDIADWQAQYNQGAGRNNPIRIPKTDEEIALAKQGQFNQEPMTAQAQTNESQHLINKLANGLGDVRAGYMENLNNGYKPENMYYNDNKGAMTRLGEMAGTVNRFYRNPAVQGLVNGLATGLMTGSPITGAMTGVATAKGKELSRVYQDTLKRYGIDVGNLGTYGDISGRDFNNLMAPEYKKMINDVALAKLEETQDWHDVLEKLYFDRLEEDKRKNTANIELRKEANNIRKITAQNKGKGGGKKSPQDHPDFLQDLAGYLKRKRDPRYKNAVVDGSLEADFIAKYGVSPERYLKIGK